MQSVATTAKKSLTLYQTTVGKKAVMAVSGLVLVGFVLGHLAGNLQLYLGQEAINAYSAFLHSMPALPWVARLVLLGAVGAHIVTAVQLAKANSAARPYNGGYRATKKHLATNYAARTMYWSGPILLIFIVYHLMHLSFGFTPGYTYSETDVYNNIVHGFMNPMVAGVYIVGNLALAFHLFHGVWSMFQSIGLNHPRYDKWKLLLARSVGVVVAVGNISFPIAVMTGVVGPAPTDEGTELEEAATLSFPTEHLARAERSHDAFGPYGAEHSDVDIRIAP